MRKIKVLHNSLELLGKELLIISDIKSSPATQAIFRGSPLIKPRVDFFYSHLVESVSQYRFPLIFNSCFYFLLLFFFPFQFFSFLSFIFSSLFPVLLVPSSPSIETAWFLLKTNNDNNLIFNSWKS